MSFRLFCWQCVSAFRPQPTHTPVADFFKTVLLGAHSSCLYSLHQPHTSLLTPHKSKWGGEPDLKSAHTSLADCLKILADWSCTVLTSSVPTYFSDFADQCLVKLSWQLFVPYRHRIQWNQNISADIRPNWDTHVKYIHFACFVFAQNCHWFKNITSKGWKYVINPDSFKGGKKRQDLQGTY